MFARDALIDGKLIVEHDRQRRIEYESSTVMRGIDLRLTWELATAGLRRLLRPMQ